jgi:hypothetical protein
MGKVMKGQEKEHGGAGRNSRHTPGSSVEILNSTCAPLRMRLKYFSWRSGEGLTNPV